MHRCCDPQDRALDILAAAASPWGNYFDPSILLLILFPWLMLLRWRPWSPGLIRADCLLMPGAGVVASKRKIPVFRLQVSLAPNDSPMLEAVPCVLRPALLPFITDLSGVDVPMLSPLNLFL